MTKTYLLLFFIALFAVSCSKKVEINGKINGTASPLERVEFIEASGVATLPLTNIGVDANGNFKGDFEAPKNGMYVISYAGKQNLIYLKGGQTVNISGNAATFPTEYVINGDAKGNNDFLQNSQKFLAGYAGKVNMQEMMQRDEASFLKGIQKIHDDLVKNIEENAKKTKADNDVVEWKKHDLASTILSIMAQYETTKAMASGNPAYKSGKNFVDFENKLQPDKDKMVKEIPSYRNYLLSKMTADFQKYGEANNKDNKLSMTELFNNYLKTQKDVSQVTKDYLLAYVMAQSDIQPTTPKETQDKIAKIIENDIKDAGVKADLKKIQFVVSGLKVGEAAPDAALIKQDGKAFKISENNGKPTMMVFYASWNPYISESVIPVLTEVTNFYKSKMNFVYVNLDDTKDQFIKTSNALMKGLPGTNVYAEGGLKSDLAKKYGIYGFKLPSFVVLDKTGKVASRAFFNLGDPEMVTVLDRETGLKAPSVQPEVQLQNQLIPQQESAQQQAPATK
ncbi:TlpA family protein disulfide reductase [Chryseobacterium sp.]|uniref:TlpA family protein disulfide reductase n=1 Tax=Chryseobacterium sp. TaxID=1871047 RepID=UPI0011CC9BBD|nr:TlpA disulfide reductase family protein [Chryseobacterium sp.]TXF77272.1 redoxin domain-containing protein [Chryseobacterium sp.]